MQTKKTPSNLLALTDLRQVSLMIGANLKMFVRFIIIKGNETLKQLFPMVLNPRGLIW